MIVCRMKLNWAAKVRGTSVCTFCLFVLILTSSLEYPERIQRGLEWTQLLKRLSVGQLPRVSTEDRVVSVFEFRVCLFFVLCSLSANFLIFPSFILLFLYSTVQKSGVQYSYLFIKLSLL